MNFDIIYKIIYKRRTNSFAILYPLTRYKTNIHLLHFCKSTKGIDMKEKLLNILDNPELSFEKYKNNIDEFINHRQIDKLKLQPNYFEITNNYWIVDKYIAMSGQVNLDTFPNTLSAYSQAIKEKYAICIPVQMLDDDNIVCFSHKAIAKVINGASGYLNNLNLSELKNLSLNNSDEKVPTLDEALEHIAGKTPIIIEINNEGMIGKFEDKVLSSLQKYITKYNNYYNVAISSINPYTLQYCYTQYPYITRILKSGAFKEKTYGSMKTSMLKKLKLYKITHADFICYSSGLLPTRRVYKHKPVGVLASDVSNQNQYIAVAPYADNIIFSNFKPTI